RRRRSLGEPRRSADPAHPARVRPPGGAREEAAARVIARGAAGAGVGLPARGRHQAGQRPRAAAALEGRARPRATRDRRDGSRRRLQGGPGLSQVSSSSNAPQGSAQAESTSTGPAPVPFHIVPTSMGRRIRRILRRIVTRWRRSIQIRVVSTTLVVSAIVVALLGFIVLEQVKSGLLEAKLHSSSNEELSGRGTAQQILSQGSGLNALQTTVQSLISPHSRGQPGSYEVVGF